MTFAMVCASHSPLLLDNEFASQSVCDQVVNSFEKMRDFIDDFAPEVIVQFSPDHFHGFHYDNMPSFCLGAACSSMGDWSTSPGPLNVDEDMAIELANFVRESEIDLSISYNMLVDHGFVQIWEVMWGNFIKYPIIPIFINSIAPPLPPYRRARMLGDAVGKFAMHTGKRVLFAGSGGLSHDPAVPSIKGASKDLRERLVGRIKPEGEVQAKREAQVRAAAVAAMNGTGSSMPLNPDWDVEFMRLISDGNFARLDAFAPDEVSREAGSAGNEVLCWVAAAAALNATGSYRTVQSDYVAVDGWIAGVGHMSAVGSQ